MFDGAPRAEMGGVQRRPPAESTSLAAGGSVLLAELVHAAGGVHHLLLARVERMAVGANLDLEVLPEGGAGLERVAA